MGNYDFIKNFLGKSANLGKDVHDLSNREAYSMPFGTFVPVSYIKVVPNESYEVNIGAAVQTAPMREDNFARINNNLKAVFVPMSSLCRDYLKLTSAHRTTRKDSLLDFVVRDLRFNIGDVLSVASPIYFLQQWFQGIRSFCGEKFFSCAFAVNEDDNTRIDLYYLDDSNQKVILNPDSEDGSNRYVDFINSKYSSFDFTEDQTSLSLVQLYHQFENYVTLSGNLFCTDVLRLLDNLGYGNYVPLLQSHVDLFLSTGISSVKIGEPFVFGFDDVEGSYNILIEDVISNFLNDGYDSIVLRVPHINVSLLPLLAYQYYISLCERSNYRNPSVSVLTLDAILNWLEHDGSLGEFYVPSGITDVHLRVSNDLENYNSFYFLDCVSAASDVRSGGSFQDGNDLHANFINLFSLSNPLLQQDLFTSSQLSVVNGSVPATNSTALNNNLVQTMNEVSALYKLRQDLLRAGVRRDKQMQALFGVSGNQHVYEPVQVLDSSSTTLNINGLVNMADTDVAPLGARGARGDGKNGLSFKARFEDYGFIFIVQSFTCDAFYENFMIDNSWQIGSESWFMPHFNNLGLEPIRSFDLSVLCSSSESLSENIVLPSNGVVGFSSRYWRLKTRLDKLHGLFTNFAFQPSGEQIVDVYQRSGQDVEMRYGNGAFGGYVPSLIQQQVNYYNYESSLYYYPTMVNNLFVQMVNGTIFNDQSFDQFRCVMSIDCKKISPMPKLGLLKLLVG